LSGLFEGTLTTAVVM